MLLLAAAHLFCKLKWPSMIAVTVPGSQMMVKHQDAQGHWLTLVLQRPDPPEQHKEVFS